MKETSDINITEIETEMRVKTFEATLWLKKMGYVVFSKEEYIKIDADHTILLVATAIASAILGGGATLVVCGL